MKSIALTSTWAMLPLAVSLFCVPPSISILPSDSRQTTYKACMKQSAFRLSAQDQPRHPVSPIANLPTTNPSRPPPRQSVIRTIHAGPTKHCPLNTSQKSTAQPEPRHDIYKKNHLFIVYCLAVHLPGLATQSTVQYITPPLGPLTPLRPASTRSSPAPPAAGLDTWPRNPQPAPDPPWPS